jgi:hypothetical protein
MEVGRPDDQRRYSLRMVNAPVHRFSNAGQFSTTFSDLRAGR